MALLWEAQVLQSGKLAQASPTGLASHLTHTGNWGHFYSSQKTAVRSTLCRLGEARLWTPSPAPLQRLAQHLAFSSHNYPIIISSMSQQQMGGMNE